MRDVVVEHVGDPLDVQPAGGDVGGDQDVDAIAATSFEGGDGPLTQSLRDVAVDGRRGKPSGAQLFGYLFGGLLGPDEDDHRLERLDFEDPGQRVHLARAGNLDVALRNVVGGRGFRVDLDLDRVVQILVAELADRRRHRRGEQRHLLVLRGLRQDPLDFLGEAHRQHLVGLVEHQVIDMGQIQGARARGGRSRGPGVPTTTCAPRFRPASCGM